MHEHHLHNFYTFHTFIERQTLVLSTSEVCNGYLSPELDLKDELISQTW